MSSNKPILKASIVFLICTFAFILVSLASGLFVAATSNFYAVTASTAIVELLALGLPILLYKLISGRPWSSFGAKKTNVALILLAIMLAANTIPMISLIQLLWTNGLESLGISLSSAHPPAAQTFGQALFAVLSYGVVAALTEELLFRGLLLRAASTCQRAMALVLTSLLFMLMHCSLEALPYTFMAGLLMGWLTLMADSIWPAVAFHAANNTLSVLAQALSSDIPVPEPTSQLEMLTSSISSAFFCAGIAALLLFAFYSITRRQKDRCYVPAPTQDGFSSYLPFFPAGLVLFALLVMSAFV